jgi:hypothetical protein
VSIADQLWNTSHTLAAHATADQLAVLRARIDAIKWAQERLAGELAALHSQHSCNSCASLPDVVRVSSLYSKTPTADLEKRLMDVVRVQKLMYVHSAEKERSAR